jgi:hypothetical protein
MLGWEPPNFLFFISTLYTTDVWYAQFWVKIAVEYWWGNNECTLKVLCFSKLKSLKFVKQWNIIAMTKMCECNL